MGKYHRLIVTAYHPSDVFPDHRFFKQYPHPPTLFLLSLLLGVSIISLAPDPTAAEEPSAEFELLKEETVSVASRYEQPISEAPSNVYVITDEDIRQSGSPDLPTVLRRIPGIEVMQTTGADFNVSARGDNQLLANKMLVLVDGRSSTWTPRPKGIGRRFR
jgi:iron complex outermembrane receptor protein